MTDLSNYLYRVYNRFRIIPLDNNHELGSVVEVLNRYNLNQLVKLLVFGHIEVNGYYSRNENAKMAFLSLLYNKDDGSISPIAVNLIRDMPDSRVFQVDLGYLMLGKEDGHNYRVSLDTFIWILIFYSSKHYRDIKQNIIGAIRRLIEYCATKEGKRNIIERFPKLRDDIEKLEKIINEASKSNHVIKPSTFYKVISSIGNDVLRYIEKYGDRILEAHKISVSPMGDTEVISEYGRSNLSSRDLENVLNAMFEIFKAGYYPASISSVLPDTIFATMNIKGVGKVSGLADYLITLPGKEYVNIDYKEDKDGDNIVRVVLRGAYATTSILDENYERWSHIEKRLPGAWRLFKIIYNRLKNGEYDTKEYKFSAYRFPFPIKNVNEDIEGASKVSWLTLFSSFIMGHILNLVGRNDAKQLYKIAAPVVRLSDENIFLVPSRLHELDRVVVRYSLEGGAELRPIFEGEWLKYVADDYYTGASNNPTGGVGYNARYSLIIAQQDSDNSVIPKEISILASDSNPAEWQETVEGRVVATAEGIKALDLILYDDNGQPIDIATVRATSNRAGDFIEPKELHIERKSNIDTKHTDD
jgi:hypothetical protein